ncbi:MAG: dihydrodipicolinate synthase family protein [Lautropia sp.]
MTTDRIRRALEGVSGIHVTAFDAEDRVDAAVTGEVVARIARAGIHNIVTGGNTGEFYAQTIEEIQRVQRVAVAAARAVAKSGGPDAIVTAGIGRSLADAVALGRSAEAAGADLLMLHSVPDPFASPAGIVGYARTLAGKVGLPIMLYLRTDAIPIARIRELAGVKGIVGVKAATGNLLYIADCLRETRDTGLQWVSGLAEVWAPAHYSVGLRGFTSGLVNLWPQRTLAVHAALGAGNYPEATRLIDEIAVFEQLRASENNGANVTVVKEAMRILGDPVGPARVPGTPTLDPERRRTLDRLLGEWDLPRLVDTGSDGPGRPTGRGAKGP